MTIAQFGVPGGMELVVLALVFVVPLGIAYWVYGDAKRRGSDYAANWAISMFLFTLLGVRSRARRTRALPQRPPRDRACGVRAATTTAGGSTRRRHGRIRPAENL